jgi:hypothetical protein
MINVAAEVSKLRQERLATNQLAQGLVQISERRQATAASYKAQADLLQASLCRTGPWQLSPLSLSGVNYFFALTTTISPYVLPHQEMLPKW